MLSSLYNFLWSLIFLIVWQGIPGLNSSVARECFNYFICVGFVTAFDTLNSASSLLSLSLISCFSKKWYIYITPFPYEYAQRRFTMISYPQRIGSIYRRNRQPLLSGPCMLALISPTPGWVESWVNFRGKDGHPNIQTSTRPGIEPETSGLGGRDLITAPTPPQCTLILNSKHLKIHKLYW